MTDAFIGNSQIRQIYGLRPGKTFEEEFSVVSLENILFDIISYFIYLLRQLFDKHLDEVNEMIYNQKSGKLAWYRHKALMYQDGFQLLPESEYFDNSGATPEAIAESKIVKYAAVVEGDEPGHIVIKVAGTDGDPIPDLTGLTDYFERIKYAGTRINLISYLPDLLALQIDIYRDPLILTDDGMSIRNGNYPVNEAIEQYLKELPFNGELVLAHLIDRLQMVEGVRIPNLISAQTKWINPTAGGYGNWEQVNVKKIPVSGRYKVENFNGIRYVV